MSNEWFAAQRQEFIKERLDERGFVNRSDIAMKFGVSISIASRDIQIFQRDNPDVMWYDLRNKNYRKVTK